MASKISYHKIFMALLAETGATNQRRAACVGVRDVRGGRHQNYAKLKNFLQWHIVKGGTSTCIRVENLIHINIGAILTCIKLATNVFDTVTSGFFDFEPSLALL